ncbi:hypothetical protein [Mesorhizobium waimense]|uniref:hypothetical protein n=1 Tax=Mesorhizobium waimense TaxID=1300307 RepID=UPI0011C3C971|nr:hypothetical protein [Mesorhizobium waimense]
MLATQIHAAISLGRAIFLILKFGPELHEIFAVNDRLLLPARHFNHADEVVGDRTVDVQERRAILADIESCWMMGF